MSLTWLTRASTARLSKSLVKGNSLPVGSCLPEKLAIGAGSSRSIGSASVQLPLSSESCSMAASPTRARASASSCFCSWRLSIMPERIQANLTVEG